MTRQHTILLIHPVDPRGKKIGGIETHVRQLIANSPDDVRLVFIGIDDLGDLHIGKINHVTYAGRHAEFLPILRFPEQQLHVAAKSILSSLTFRFFLALFRHSLIISKLARQTHATADLQRVEFSWFCAILGIPYVLMLHGEAPTGKNMDSIIKKFWYIQKFNERFAVGQAKRILCVTESFTTLIREQYPHVASKTATMTVCYDNTIFIPKAFETIEGPLEIVFVGRLDLFKRPSLIFRVVAGLSEKLNGGVRFHYIGNGNPMRFNEFTAIESLTTLHGFRTSVEVAIILQRIHIGLLCSEFEGTPVYVMELLGCGRPLVSVHLPQLGDIIENGVSGIMIEENDGSDLVCIKLIDAALSIWSLIRCRALNPQVIASKVATCSISIQLSRLFEYHRQISSS